MSTVLTARPTAEQVTALTPVSRNRYADLLRLSSLVVVVLGHWLMAGVTVSEQGIQGTNILVARPWTQWLTWVFQVMPVFFFVGGFANATGWASARTRGTGYVAWMRTRAARLLRPTLPVLVLWIPLAVVLGLTGVVPSHILDLGIGAVLIPLWFLAVYIVVVALTPVTVWLHERFGVRAAIGLAVLAFAVDMAHLAGVPLVGMTNFVWVWAAVHQLGYLWRDGTVTRAAITPAVMAVAGLVGLIGLTTIGGYPVSMLGIDAAVRTNNMPPSVALFVLGVMQMGLLLMARHHVERWLQHPRRWARVVAGGSVAMTLYLWHMTALVAGIGLALVLHLVPATAFDAGWWITRPAWIAMLAMLLLPLIAIFRRFEQVSAGSAQPTRPLTVTVTVAGVAAVAAGLGLLIGNGLPVPGEPVTMPLAGLAALGGGLAALGVVRITGR